MRRERPTRPEAGMPIPLQLLDWHRALLSRRAFLVRLAGVSAAALFGPTAARAAAADAEQDSEHRWALLDAVQQHLFPSELDSPGAREIQALTYLRFVLADSKVDTEERRFILAGTAWLDDLSQQRANRRFLDLDEAARESLLRQVAASPQGENWLSTLLLYLMEALLTDPAYGGNPDGIGWRWLEHTPGYPRPSVATLYPRLPL
ncbi:gluconate 2-dehydrogenase subunit 3 family protein [Thiocystis violascens]|uniref:Gluconate 2-dehydrogenase subunit 3 n=1 Tax=Thiocystis violascens (strain ATCC 17096 / DSM 198 / 6111) TaxID=765911 RepID=I3YH24_THIV6|nr:gluconate 2-dehydrogenase subunit 3 family protein [Thiocystis violascens]AFL76292.1 hypothetical protein Thivi_4496 [Thiocystis violascens DSM 198]